MMEIVPWAMAIGFAAIARFFEEEKEEGPPKQRSIEMCVGNCSALWLAENGVLRIYAEQTDVECYRVVVDCSTPPSSIPGEIDGWPVRIRVGSKETPVNRASRMFARKAMAMGYELRPVTSPDGQVSVVSPEEGGAAVLVEGSQISRSLIEEAERIAKTEKISVSIGKTPPMGPFGHPVACVVRFTPK